MEPFLASFRDPDGSVFSAEGRIFRAVKPPPAAILREALETPAAVRLLAEGRIVATAALDVATAESIFATAASGWRAAGHTEFFEHERIPFPSYPYEWPAEMLHAAAGLTLDIARQLLPHGFGIKDATPYNILFRGPNPVLVDVLSLEARDPRDPIWRPYGQFVRTFLLPLALSRCLGVPPDHLLLVRRDGVEPDEVYRWLPASQRLRRPFFSLVTIPTWLGRRDTDDPAVYQPRRLSNPEEARFVLGKMLGRARRTLDRLEPDPGRKSEWSGYTDSTSYSPADAAAKAAFVEQALTDYRPQRVLDVGANTGRFSELAAACGASVVAIDRDPVVIGALWRKARAKGAGILPLAVDISRPTPATGWRNNECAPFLARCRDHFDAVLMLALIHHLVVTERIPLPEVIGLAADLTTGLAIIEFVGRGDAMFRRLLRGRDHLYEGVTEEAFETSARRHFDIIRRVPLGTADRILYLLRKR